MPTDAAGAAVRDAIDRVVAGLPEGAAATGLRRALEELVAAISGNTAVPVASAIARADATLDAYRTGANAATGDAPDLEVIALALAAADAAVRRGAGTP